MTARDLRLYLTSPYTIGMTASDFARFINNTKG